MALVYQFNILFFLPYFLHSNNIPISIFSFLLSALSANTKWKALLFIYASTNSYFFDTHYFSKIMFLASIFLSFNIYRNLIFDTITENKQYFSGLFSLMVLFGFRSLSDILNVSLHTISQIILSGLCISLGYSIICYRFEKLREREVSTIKSPR